MKKLAVPLVPIILLALIFGSIACGGYDDQMPFPLAQPTETSETPIPEATIKETPKPASNATITIGNLANLTGPSSASTRLIDMALEDLVAYYNSNSLIPGVELEIITYDKQLDAENDLLGYEWLKENGSDFIFSSVPMTGVTLKDRAAADKFLVFETNGFAEVVEPHGYVFVLGSVLEYEIYTLLDWIAEYDWDYQTRGPAKIGGIVWDEAHSNKVFTAVRNYARANPDQFKSPGRFFSGSSFTSQVEAVQGYDYVFPTIVPMSFIRAFKNSNDNAVFFGADTHLNYLGTISNVGLWGEIDGMLFISDDQWWNEDGLMADLSNQLLQLYHADDIKEIQRSGGAYLSAGAINTMLDIVATTVENTGPEEFSSQALYSTIQSYSAAVDGIEDYYSFSGTKCYATNYYSIFKASAAEEDLLRDDNSLQRLITNP